MRQDQGRSNWESAGISEQDEKLFADDDYELGLDDLSYSATLIIVSDSTHLQLCLSTKNVMFAFKYWERISPTL